MTALIKEAYKVRDNMYLVADTRGKAFWTDIPSKSASRYDITEETFIKLVEYFIDNIYVSIGTTVYRQCVGIPMGTDCTPLVANLFLFYYEYTYMKNLIKNNIIRMWKDVWFYAGFFLLSIEFFPILVPFTFHSLLHFKT